MSNTSRLLPPFMQPITLAIASNTSKSCPIWFCKHLAIQAVTFAHILLSFQHHSQFDAKSVFWCKMMQNSKIMKSWFYELLSSGIVFSYFLQPITVFFALFYLDLVLKKENQGKCKIAKSYVLITETTSSKTLVWSQDQAKSRNVIGLLYCQLLSKN